MPELVFNCPTCSLERRYTLDSLEPEILKLAHHGVVVVNGKHKQRGFSIGFYTVMDLDTGVTKLSKLRSSPPVRNVEDAWDEMGT
jgi:hypothetical protein